MDKTPVKKGIESKNLVRCSVAMIQRPLARQRWERWRQTGKVVKTGNHAQVPVLPCETLKKPDIIIQLERSLSLAEDLFVGLSRKVKLLPSEFVLQRES
jgi:hypothetical protein